MMNFEADPEFGEVLANYPSDRARLLLISGAILAAVWFVVTVALWQVEATTAALITVGVFSLATLLVGWYMAHLWNREVVLFARGFSYREGSREAYLRYSDVVAIRQKAARVAYFGGLLQRTIYRTTLKTNQDETIVLGGVYRRIAELSLKLEEKTTAARRPIVQRQLSAGETVAFGAWLSLSPTGLVFHPIPANRYSYTHPDPAAADRVLPWDDYEGYQVGQGALVIAAVSQPVWCAVNLEEIDNARLLIELLSR